MNKVTKMVAAGISTVALVGAIGAGLAYADPDPIPRDPAGAPSASPTPKADRSAAARQHRGLIRRALHGEVTLQGEKHRVVAFQRGRVESVTATSLAVTSEDAFRATYVLNSDTRVRKQKEDASVSDIKAGDRVRVVALKDGSTLTATAVRDHGK